MTRTEARMIAEELFRLFEKNGFKPQMIAPERYLTAREAAKLLGMPLNTLYKKVAEIPHIKQGKRHVFKESALREWMDQGAGTV